MSLSKITGHSWGVSKPYLGTTEIQILRVLVTFSKSAESSDI